MYISAVLFNCLHLFIYILILRHERVHFVVVVNALQTDWRYHRHRYRCHTVCTSCNKRSEGDQNAFMNTVMGILHKKFQT